MGTETLVASQITLWLVVLANMGLTLVIIRRLSKEQRGTRPGLAVGDLAPEFTAETLMGEPLSRSDFQPRTAFVFLAPGCPPCVESLPELMRLAKIAKSKGTDLVLVSSGDAASTRQLLAEAQVSGEMVVAPRTKHDFFERYRASSTPHFTLVENGKVVMAGAPYSSNQEWRTLVSDWENSDATALAANRSSV